MGMCSTIHSPEENNPEETETGSEIINLDSSIHFDTTRKAPKKIVVDVPEVLSKPTIKLAPVDQDVSGFGTCALETIGMNQEMKSPIAMGREKKQLQRAISRKELMRVKTAGYLKPLSQKPAQNSFNYKTSTKF